MRNSFAYVCALPRVCSEWSLPLCQILREFQRPVGAHSKRALGADGPGGAAGSSSPPGRGRYVLSCPISIAAVLLQRRSLQRFPVSLVMSNVWTVWVDLGMLSDASLLNVLSLDLVIDFCCTCAPVCCVRWCQRPSQASPNR